MELLLTLASLGCFATTYFVDNTSGDDSNDGLSMKSAFATLNHATHQLKPGDELQIKPGKVYHESLEIRSGGKPGSPIVVKGNGSVLTGMEPVPDDSWEKVEDDLWLSRNKGCWGALEPMVLDRTLKRISVASHRSVKSERAKTLKPGEAMWNTDGIWYRAESGETPVGAGLNGYYRESGVKLCGQSHVIIEGIVSERFANDGFNVHGSSHDIIFRNIEARYNGDDGFSIHEDSETVVCKGWFHHNKDGIADIQTSQSRYYDVIVEHNELYGVGFWGGFRAMRDCVVRQNGGEQIFLRRGKPSKKSKNKEPNDMHIAHGYFTNVRVEGVKGKLLNAYESCTATAVDCELVETCQ